LHTNYSDLNTKKNVGAGVVKCNHPFRPQFLSRKRMICCNSAMDGQNFVTESSIRLSERNRRRFYWRTNSQNPNFFLAGLRRNRQSKGITAKSPPFLHRCQKKTERGDSRRQWKPHPQFANRSCRKEVSNLFYHLPTVVLRRWLTRTRPVRPGQQAAVRDLFTTRLRHKFSDKGQASTATYLFDSRNPFKLPMA